jgi:hypothetical protein
MRKAGAVTPAFFVSVPQISVRSAEAIGLPEVSGAFATRSGDPFAHFAGLGEVFHFVHPLGSVAPLCMNMGHGR